MPQRVQPAEAGFRGLGPGRERRRRDAESIAHPAQAAARVNLPTMTVVPTQYAAAPVAPSTNALGAGPAPSQMPRTANGTVITELHNPALTGVQSGNRLSIVR